MTTALIKIGHFELHSGQKTKWKIDCDGLDSDSLYALANMANALVGEFGHVKAIPDGGERLAAYMSQYSTLGCRTMLIIDDVMTTGASMMKRRQQLRDDGNQAKIKGLVIFDRIPGGKGAMGWVTSLFHCNNELMYM